MDMDMIPLATNYHVSRVRRNHALEHATLNVLAGKKKHPLLAGYSDFNGFWIMGDVDTQELQLAVDEALMRLRNGEADLSLNANCGTNFAVSGILAGTAAWLGMLGCESNWRRRLERLPVVISLITLVLIISRPLGMKIQAQYTTMPDPGSLQVVSIMIHDFKGLVIHRIRTRH